MADLILNGELTFLVYFNCLVNMMHSTYLVAYNVGMFVAHFYVLALLIYGYFIQRSEGNDGGGRCYFV